MKLLEHFEELTVHPKNAEELKGLILQLAVQGKLTKKWRDENPDVEPAAVLLERIAAEKRRLVSEKKISKVKDFETILDEEISFELPQTWSWCRLGVYIHNFGQKTPDAKFEYIDVASVDNKLGTISGNLEVVSPNQAPSRARKIVKEGCVIYSTVRPYLLNIAIIDRKFKIEAIASTAFAILNPLVGCSVKYLYHVLRSTFFIEYVERCMKGVAYPAINDRDLLKGLIPIPPLEEQKAIVSIVNQLFAAVEALEQQTKVRIQLKEDFVTSALQQLATGDTATEWAFLQEHFKTFFTEKLAVKKLREGILQLAVQGKLTSKWREENPDVEPASILLERIKAEKNRLIKAKKVRKNSDVPEIKDTEIPFVIPENWIWCRFDEIVINRDGERKPITKSDRVHGEYDYYGASGIIDKVKDYIFDKDLLLIGEDGANLIARSTPIAFFAKGKYWVNNHAHVLDATEFTILEFLEKYINAINLEDFITGMAQPKMPQKRMNIIPVPLPPLEEQKAIVAKVNALMALCDHLEKEIEQNTRQLAQLMQSCLREVFEGEEAEEAVMGMAAEPEARYGNN